MKKLTDYLHFYLGCGVLLPDGSTETLDYVESDQLYFYSSEKKRSEASEIKIEDVKLILRSIHSETQDEKMQQLTLLKALEQDNPELISAEAQAHLLKWKLDRHFDLFGLIDAGLAVDSKMITTAPDPTFVIKKEDLN